MNDRDDVRSSRCGIRFSRARRQARYYRLTGEAERLPDHSQAFAAGNEQERQCT